MFWLQLSAKSWKSNDNNNKRCVEILSPRAISGQLMPQQYHSATLEPLKSYLKNKEKKNEVLQYVSGWALQLQMHVPKD